MQRTQSLVGKTRRAQFPSRIGPRGMSVLVLEKPGTLVWSAEAIPVPKNGELLVRVRRCGVSDTDLEAVLGQECAFPYPRRVGHELCVEVMGRGRGGLKGGDLCAVESSYACGGCSSCLAGEATRCRDLKLLGLHLNGGHSPFLSVPFEKLHRANALNPDEVALLEPMVVGADCIRRASVRAGESIAIIGLNLPGLAAALFAKAAGAKVACVDARLDRRVLACDRLGLGRGFVPNENLVAELNRHFGQSPAIVIDANGGRSALKDALQIAGDHGMTAFLGLFAGDVIFHRPEFNQRNLAPFTHPADLSSVFRYVIRQIQSGKVNIGPLITHRFGFAEARERLPSLRRERGLVKAIIDFDGFYQMGRSSRKKSGRSEPGA